MRVLLVINSLGGGGAERVMSWLANQLSSGGHEVRLLVRSKPETDVYEIDPRVQILRHVPRAPKVGASPASSRLRRAPRTARNRVTGLADYIAFAYRLRQDARATQVDVVLSFIDVMNVHVSLALLGSKCRVVLSERVDPVFHQLGRVEFLRPILYRRASAIVVQSEDIAARIREKWQIRRVTVVGNPRPSLPRAPKPLAARPNRVLAVGRLHPQKDHISLVKAWSLIGEERDGWELFICGEGQEESILRKAIDERGLDASVFLPGRRVEIGEEYNNAKIFVMSSLYEGFPNALVEAMAWGCATVATNCPGSSSEILKHGEVGLMVPPGDPEALADAIRTLMVSSEVAENFGSLSQHRVADFSPTEVYGKWMTVLSPGSQSAPSDN